VRRLRVSGQLVSAETGALIRADRFEGEMSDLFDLQDRFTESVVAAIEPSLRRAEVRRRPRSALGPTLGHKLVPYNRGLGPRTPTLQDARWNKPGRSG
jgi:hypothetical protein